MSIIKHIFDQLPQAKHAKHSNGSNKRVQTKRKSDSNISGKNISIWLLTSNHTMRSTEHVSKQNQTKTQVPNQQLQNLSKPKLQSKVLLELLLGALLLYFEKTEYPFFIHSTSRFSHLKALIQLRMPCESCGSQISTNRPVNIGLFLFAQIIYA